MTDEQRKPGQSIINFKLDLILKKCETIEDCLFGDSAGRDGLKMDVDRLKRSRMTHNAVLWVLFTTLLGVAGTVVAEIIKSGP